MDDYEQLKYCSINNDFPKIKNLVEKHEYTSMQLYDALLECVVYHDGDVEIVKRSTRAFLKTITDFNFVEKIDQDTYHQLPKQDLSDEQVIDIMQLFSEYNNTKQINLNSSEISLFAWYKTPDLDRIASKYHPTKWEYIKGIDRSFLMLK